MKPSVELTGGFFCIKTLSHILYETNFRIEGRK